MNQLRVFFFCSSECEGENEQSANRIGDQRVAAALANKVQHAVAVKLGETELLRPREDLSQDPGCLCDKRHGGGQPYGRAVICAMHR